MYCFADWLVLSKEIKRTQTTTRILVEDSEFETKYNKTKDCHCFYLPSLHEGVFLVLKVKASLTVVLQSNLAITFQTHCIRPWMLNEKHFIFGNGRAH